MIYQISLPTIDMRPICPACKRPANLLAQWSPGDKVFVCRDCYMKAPPPAIFRHHTNSRGVGLIQDDDQETRLAWEKYHDLVNSLDKMRRGCVYTLRDHVPGHGLPCERGGHESYWNCRLCRKEARKASQKHKPTMWRGQIDQLNLPVCHRCGCVHARQWTHVHGYANYCQQCDDKNSIEALFRNRGVFAGQDDETILDRLHAAFRPLFDRGVLPDYWYKLKGETAHAVQTE